MGDDPVRKAFRVGERQFLTAEERREDVYVGVATIETTRPARWSRPGMATALWIFVIFGLGVLCGLLLENWVS
jgi:hypothetical protein